MKSVLITGASGFIGGFLVDVAIKKGYKTYAGIRKTSSLKYLQSPEINLFEIDLSNKTNLKNKFGGFDRFDYVIHNAGITKTCKKESFTKINYTYTRNLIEALIETKKIPDKFVYISSLAAYGPGKGDCPIKLTDIPSPVSEYGISKLKTENYIKSLTNFPYLIFRPTGVYGPREKDYYVMFKTVKAGLETYVGTKKQYLSFVYVKDLTTLLINSLQTNSIRKSYFVSDLKKYTVAEFNKIIKQKLDKKTITIVMSKTIVKIIAFLGEKLSCFFTKNSPTLNTEKYKDISQNNWLCDSSELINDFNFRPEYDLEKGVNETINWYRNEGLL